MTPMRRIPNPHRSMAARPPAEMSTVLISMPFVEVRKMDEVRSWFSEFEQLSVLMQDGDHVLSLGLPAVAAR